MLFYLLEQMEELPALFVMIHRWGASGKNPLGLAGPRARPFLFFD
jgi:hypothetical protein